MLRSALASALVALVCLVACSSSSPASGSASTACAGDGDCKNGLKCLGLATFSGDGGCTEGQKACSTACASDADCASLGAGYKCFGGCGTTKFCGATQ